MRRVFIELFVLAIAIGLTVEVIKSAIPYLPFIWLLVLAHYTWEIISSQRVLSFWNRIKSKLSGKKLILSYVLMAVAGVGLLVAYLWGLNSFFAPRIAKYEAEQREKKLSNTAEKHEESRKEEPPRVESAPATKQKIPANPLTLKELFLTDFGPNLSRTRYDTAITIGSKTGKFQPVTEKFISQLWIDLREGTQFLGFYIPMQDKDPEESSKKTVFLCRNLPTYFPEIVKHLQGIQASASNERGSMYKSIDLPLSSRVYVYHEDFMSPQDTGDLVREYEARQLQLEFRGSEYRAKQELLRAVQHPQIDQRIDPEISKLRADATSLINRIYRRYAEARKHDMDILSSQMPQEKKQFIVATIWGTFSKEYDKDFKQEVLDVHKALLGHVRALPKSDPSVEETYKVYPQPPGFPKILPNAVEIEMQLGDLRSLLNEMERENNLPLSCQDLVLRFGP